MSQTPVVGETFTFGVGLFQQADTRLLQAAPTIAAGDFQRSINGGAFANLDNLPTVTPAAGTRVQVIISAAETTAAAAGGSVWVRWVDAAGAQWCGGFAEVRPAANEMDDLPASIWTYATRTLTSFGTLVADIWTYGTRTLTSFGTLVADVCSCVKNALLDIPYIRKCRTQDLDIIRGDTWSQPILRLGDISDDDEIWFTAKRDKDLLDTQADIKISSVDGLEYINQAAATVAGNGSVTVDDATIGNITVTLEPVEAAKLSWGDVGTMHYDVQVKDVATGRVRTLRRGLLHLIADITRET